MRLNRTCSLILLILFTAAFTAPQKGDLIELKAWLNGRSDAKFRSADENKIFMLGQGTRGSVEEVKHFPKTNNFGVCIKVLNSPQLDQNQRCVWVYYNPSKPNLKLYSVAKDSAEKEKQIQAWAKDDKTVKVKKLVSDPRAADAAEVTRTTAGIPEAMSEVIPPFDPSLAAQSSIDSFNQLNQNAVAGHDPLDPNSSCPDGECSPTISNSEACTSKNSYLQQDIAEDSKKDPMLSVLTMQSNNMIKESCVKRSLETFPQSTQFYRSCGPLFFRRKVHRPCVSTQYLDVTAKSFNLVASCMSDMLAESTDPQVQKQAVYSVFSLMTLESGLHTNAQSFSGAGGPSQLTHVAIEAVNEMIPQFQQHLANSHNPLCSKNLASAIADPMPASNYCSRIRMDKDNPLKNMFYGFAYQTALKQYFESQIFHVGRYSSLFSSLNPQDLLKLKSALTLWGHNAGPAGISTPAEKLLTEMLRKNVKLTSSDDVDRFLGSLKEYMQTYPHPDNSSSARRQETSNYYSSVISRMAVVEPEAKSCISQ